MLLLVKVDDSPRRNVVEADKAVPVGGICVVEADGMQRYCLVESVLSSDSETSPMRTSDCRFVRVASEEDKSRRETNARLSANAMKAFDTENAGAPQKPYAVAAFFDVNRTKLVLLYHADRPFDARRSENSLHRRFGANVVARQIGIRDEVATIGSIGPCGRPCCCAHWLKSASTLNVNVRMAKRQNVSLNPTSLNGYCEKFKCCLGFEVNAEKEESAH